MPRSLRWSLLVVAAVILAMAVVTGIDDLRRGISSAAVGAFVLAVVAVWSGRRGRHTPWARAEARIAPDHAVVLWKPGCLYCERLLLQLRKDARVSWVNVWRDENANRRVRAVNGGDELTPTVLLGTQVLRNPSAAELRERLAAAGSAHPSRDAPSTTVAPGGQRCSSSQRKPHSHGTPSTTRR
ncbi:glutaredoxin family protein [Brachybacterium vulturis]|uniref:glutaredoxin family protein n=1 Tax=Brachybacterium vulturis TaxID=2017484 RepID=UPI0037359568